MKKVTEYTVNIRIVAWDMSALFDMLRYEGARVTGWDSIATGYRIHIASERFTPDRWSSFGIRAEVKA